MISIKLTELFSKYDHKLLEDFFSSFSIDFFIMGKYKSGWLKSSKDMKDMKEIESDISYLFYNSEKEYLCAIYKVTEEEVVEKFNRFLEMKVFL